MPTPWAILLCRWSDDASEPEPRSFFEDLFTRSGAGSLNMTDYFEDCSHGRLDLGTTQVFGWYDLGFDKAAYVGNGTPGPGQLDRGMMMTRARAVAAADGVDLGTYAGVVVCFNVPTDLFGGGQGACCDPNSFRPAVLGQEMGHVYGLAHSRIDGSTADYQDRWDTMSTWSSCFIAGHPRWTEVGPGLNAFNMRSRGWLDESRVWRSSTATADEVVELRPLHRRDLPGLLAADLPAGTGLDRLLVEFRVPDRWDAAIPEATVLVHRFKDNHSYLMRGTSGAPDLRAGDDFRYGAPDFPWAPYGRVEVLSIDEDAQTARIRVEHRPGVRIREPRIGGELLGGVAVDGGGWIVIGGRVIPVPPRGPIEVVLEQLAVLEVADQLKGAQARRLARMSALETIASWAHDELHELDHLESPQPRAKGARHQDHHHDHG